jgi:glycosyltransferase involved in cell wall biosynthesis
MSINNLENNKDNNSKIAKPAVALVHDFLLYYGGAERVLKEFREIYQGAPIYTLLENEDNKELIKDFGSSRKMAEKPPKFSHKFENLTPFTQGVVKTSFLQKFPKFLRKRHKWLVPLMPTAVETFDLRDYNVIISSSSAFAKGVVVKSKIKHICYMHAPMRYVWDWNREYLEENKLKGRTKFFTRLFLNYLRMWDRISAERPDYLIANSKYTAERIKKYYRRKSTVIYPPVDVEKFTPTKENAGYFLTVGRLVPYKRVDLLIQVFQKLKLPLVIVGDGPEKEKLQKMVKDDKLIKVLGWVSDEKKAKLLEQSRAFITATEDDFNITVVEAMAAGKPVIALEKGGTAETVQVGNTGEFFKTATMEMIADALGRFIENENNYDYLKIRQRAEEFSTKIFREKIKEFVRAVSDKQ